MQNVIYDWWLPGPPMPQTNALLPQGAPVRIPTVMWSFYDPLPQYSPDEWFPAFVPQSEYADFSYDATEDVLGDPIVGLSMVVSPSGPGEVMMSRLQLMNTPLGAPALVVVWITGGVAGRDYAYELTMRTAAGRNLVVLIGQKCLPVLAQYPLIPPPSPNFGTPVTWAAP